MLSKLQVKYIQSLNQKKFRKEEGVFIAEGPKIVSELLASPQVEPVVVYGTDSWWQQPAATQLDSSRAVQINTSELERISQLPAPNQVLGIFVQPRFASTGSFDKDWSLVLDGIQDPGNMGTIIRTADWFNISQIIASPDTADPFNPKVVQSTMGSIARVQVLEKELVSFLQQHAAIPSYASTLHGRPLQTYRQAAPGFLLIGNESKGIRAELLQLCRHQLTIPRIGQAESLNAAVATGIILSQLCVQAG